MYVLLFSFGTFSFWSAYLRPSGDVIVADGYYETQPLLLTYIKAQFIYQDSKLLVSAALINWFELVQILPNMAEVAPKISPWIQLYSTCCSCKAVKKDSCTVTYCMFQPAIFKDFQGFQVGLVRCLTSAEFAVFSWYQTLMYYRLLF